MGTRHLTCVVKDGEFKVAQYGQWDGYPTGQGKTIVEFLQGRFNKEMFLKKLAKVDWITEDIMKRYWKEAGAKGDTHWVGMDVSDRFKQLHPELHRDTGAKVLEIIQMGKVKYLDNEINFANDSLFCEWCYVLDLDNDVLEV